MSTLAAGTSEGAQQRDEHTCLSSINTHSSVGSADSASSAGSARSARSTGGSTSSSRGDPEPQQQTASRPQPISSNADYDNIRNTTLLFFLDRLFIASKDGKEARTLHDLSCLFGTKDFTKEMRQIVGGSRNGLKKFLQLYPSLFTIEGDKVYLTQLKQDAKLTTRDYNQEAVDYFKQKLIQFGPSLVPIKNLFGYRSQASQEVRHVSGKNSRAFKQFLAAHEDVFEILADEHVLLKSALRQMESSGQADSLAELHSSLLPSLNPDDNQVMDPYLNKQFAHFIEDCLRKLTNNNNNNEYQKDQEDQNKEEQPTVEVSVDYLYEKIQCDCKNELFLKMIKTVEDLRVFLRMHPKLFKKYKKSCDQQHQQQQQQQPAAQDDQQEFVRLLSDQERRQLLEAHTFPASSLSRQHSTLARTNTVESQLSNGSSCSGGSAASGASHTGEPMSLPPLAASNKSQESPKQHTSHPQVSRSSSAQPTSQAPQRASSSLRANAPAFVPTSTRSPVAANRSPLSSGSQQQQPMQRSHSSLTQSSRHTDHYNHHHLPYQQHSRQQPRAVREAPIDQRGAIRSYLMKGNNAPNASANNHWPTPASNGQPPSLFNGDYLRARTVDIVREASNIISRIMNTTSAVAFDCKGYNLGFDGQITLIQFGFLPTEDEQSSPLSRPKENNNNNNNEKQQVGRVKPEVCVFDLITNPELAYCLKPLLESDRIVKIVHDVRNKSNALYVQFKIILNNVFDTQVANLVIQQQDTGKPAYKSRYISMSKLCEVYGDDELMKYRNLIKSKTRHSTTSNSGGHSSLPPTTSSRSIKDVNYWRTRPLTKPMIFESTMDVYCLVGGIYQNLKAKLRPEYEPLFDQLNLEGVLARIKPDEIRSAKRERKIDLEIIDLKRKLYSDTKGAIVLSNREIRLLRHIDLTDEVRNKIQQCKKVAKKLERLDMKAAQMLQSLEGADGAGQVSLGGPDNQLVDDTNSSSLKSSQSLSEEEQKGSLTGGERRNDNDDHNHNDDDDDDDATGHMMTNLMDSSMFDELKDKMIESSSLLESLDEDDDDIASAGEHGHLSSVHSHSGSNHDCCRCHCHRGSTDNGSEHNVSLGHPSRGSLDGGQRGGASSQTSDLADSQATCGPKTAVIAAADATVATTDENKPGSSLGSVNSDDGGSAKSTSAVDMAVQCDLLS